MIAGWLPTRLGDIVSVKHGWPFKSECFSETLTGKPIVVAVGNFRYEGGFRFDETATKEYQAEYPVEYELEPGDILLIMTCQTPGGEILGIPARIPDDTRTYLHNQRLGKIVVKEPELIDRGFLYHLFRSQPFNSALCATASGSKILHTAPTRIEAFEFLRPPIREQRAISRLLSSLDDKIEQNRRTSRALERLARAIFKAWFVDFEPVDAKAAGAASFPGMPPAAFDALPAQWIDSEIGPVPEGWKAGTMGAVGQQRREQVSPEDTDGETPYIGLEHMPRRDIALADWGRAETVTSGKSRFQRGDILFGKLRPYFHKVGCAPIAGVCSTDIVVLSPRHSDWASFLLMLVSSDDFVSHADQTSAGTKMPRTKWADMAAFPVSLPPLSLAASFEQVVRPMLQLIESNIHESRKLAELRDYLLPKLLSGEVRVAAAEASHPVEETGA